MKAAQWDSVRHPARAREYPKLTWAQKLKKAVVNDVPTPEPSENQFLVKIKSASLCHSDLMGDLRPATDTPITLGHEGVGYIEKIHPTAEGKGFKIGDAIGFGYVIGCCFKCEGCMVHNLMCETGIPKVQGFMADGYFAEYALVDWQNAIILPEKLDITRCAPIFCAGITGMDTTSITRAYLRLVY